MARFISSSLVLLAAAKFTSAYWLMGATNMLTTQRLDPLVTPGKVAGHVHGVVGGSNFAIDSTNDKLRQSQCTSIPIKEDKSAYWFPMIYHQHKNGSFSSVEGGVVIYYLFPDKVGSTTAFPDGFRMFTGDPLLRSTDQSIASQQAVSFLCLNYEPGQTTTKHAGFPNKVCPNGVRTQINFPSCWDGKNNDSPDHKSHVAFRSGGSDSGDCKDPKYPVSTPRIFMETYFDTSYSNAHRSDAMNPEQPLVLSNGDPTGYSFHADFINGWESGVLQKAVDGCNCNPYGDPTCCVQKGIFTIPKDKPTCRITNTFDERVSGMLATLPGSNAIQPAGARAAPPSINITPPMLSPVYVYEGTNTPPQVGKPVSGAVTNSAAPAATNILVVKPSASSVAASSAPSSSKIADAPAQTAPASSVVASPLPASSAVSASSVVASPLPASSTVPVPTVKSCPPKHGKHAKGRAISKRSLHARHPSFHH